MAPTPSRPTPLNSGLRWTADLFGPVPVWSKTPYIPTIESLSRRYLGADNLSVNFFAGGAFNKLYSITVSSNTSTETKSYIFRVALPVEPFYKTASEIATLRYLRRQTSIPVPEVIAYNCTVENELGFEWILMEKIPGVSLGEVWGNLNLSTKKIVAECIGQYTKQLREKCRFDAIGSLYQRTELSGEDAKTAVATGHHDFVIGPVVTTFFFAGKRKALVERNRGPYRSDREYILALTQVELEDMKLLQKLTAGAYN